MKKLLLPIVLLIALTSGVKSQKNLNISVTPFELHKDSPPMGPVSKRIIEIFCYTADKAVEFELGSPRIKRNGIKYENRANKKNAWIALEHKFDVVSVGEGTNAIISGTVFYGENRRTTTTMKLYFAKAREKGTGKAVFYETNVVRKKKSINFIEEEEKVDRMIRRMTRKLLGQRVFNTNAAYAVTGGGLVLTAIGTSLFVDSNRRYKIYKKHPYVLDPVYNRFKSQVESRKSYFKDLKRKERISYVLGGLGIAMSIFGTYEIVINKKDNERIFDEIYNGIIADIPKSQPNTLSISSDLNYSPITSRANPQAKLVYRF